MLNVNPKSQVILVFSTDKNNVWLVKEIYQCSNLKGFPQNLL